MRKAASVIITVLLATPGTTWAAESGTARVLTAAQIEKLFTTGRVAIDPCPPIGECPESFGDTADAERIFVDKVSRPSWKYYGTGWEANVACPH